jgi:hypothetical protein
MLVLLTLALSAFVGVMGIAVDYGFATFERRHMQKVVDAAALTGALDLTDSRTYANVTNSIMTMANRNNLPSGSTIGCYYIDNSLTIQQNNCSVPTGSTIAGLRVTGSRNRDTYFMRILNILQYPVSATSGATLKRAYWDLGSSLFIVCGFDTVLAPGETDWDGSNNSKADIIEWKNGPSGWQYYPKQSAVDHMYVIHDPQVSDCGVHDNAFKGLANDAANTGINLLDPVSGTTIRYLTGTRAGPTREDVRGVDGCPSGLYSDAINDCIMLIPIAISSPDKPFMKVVFYLPFRIFERDANSHWGYLVSTNYALSLDTRTAGDWALGQAGPVSARLVK